MTSQAMTESLFTYRLMQSIPTGGSYVLRLLALCFVGTHVPLIAACLYFLTMADGGIAAHIPELLILLVATLIGTAFTLGGVRLALAPIVRSSRALQRYVTDRKLPSLPLEYTDEAGRLMASVQTVTERLEVALRQQETLASIDHLTGIPNRRVLFDKSVSLLNDARREKTPLSIAVLDIDHFKSINDTHGHAAGDVVIRGVADLIKSHLQPGEIAARLGGEEFAILMPGSNAKRAAARAEAIRAAVAALLVPECPGRAITLSAGVASSRALKEPTIHAALERADHALYQSKESGRNRVTVAEAA